MNRKNMDKQLLILAEYADLRGEKSPLLHASDRLAMSPAAMLAFEEAGLAYRTFDDLYDHREFRSDNRELIKELEGLFRLLDKQCEPFVRFPRVFTGNIYWFGIFIADLYYLSRVFENIKSAYGNIYFAGDVSARGPFDIDVAFSQKGVTFTAMNAGLKNKIKIVCDRLSPERVRLGRSCDGLSRFVLDRNRMRQILEKIPRKMIKELTVLRTRFRRRKDNIIFVIQDEYEVALLKKMMPDFIFINPVARLLRRSGEDHGGSDVPDGASCKALDRFIGKWCKGFEEQVAALFRLYHEKVVRDFSGFLSDMESLFERCKPVALLYSSGSEKVFEDAFAHCANRKGIPVFYFQHGGAMIFRNDTYERFCEHNPHINKLIVLHSQVEQELLSEKFDPESKVLGSMKLYDFYHRFSQQVTGRQQRILYCASPFNIYCHKILMGHMSDKQLFEVNKDIVAGVRSVGLRMDIKVHPGDEAYANAYFSRLVGDEKATGIRVLKNIFAELIIHDYDLLIIDFLGTAILPLAFVVNIPAMVYIKDASLYNETTLPDLRKRFYLVEDRPSLERCLQSYKAGKMAAKFSNDIVDRYAFPVDAGDPFVNIPEYVRTKIADYKQCKHW